MSDKVVQCALSKLSSQEISALRMYFINQSDHQRTNFTKEEDQKLFDLVMNNPKAKFSVLARELPGKSPRQCRERWNNYLDPTIKKSPWTEEEDNLLREKYNEIGPKWVKIAMHIKNRTHVSVKNRWITLMRKDFKNSHITMPVKDGINQRDEDIISTDLFNFDNFDIEL